MDNYYTLAELSDYIFLFRNDIHYIHLYASGHNFNEIHSLLNELYDILLEFYDSVAETAIGLSETIHNPSEIIDHYREIWETEKELSYNGKNLYDTVMEKGRYFISITNSLCEYDSFIYSMIDSYIEKIDKIINYKFARTACVN